MRKAFVFFGWVPKLLVCLLRKDPETSVGVVPLVPVTPPETTVLINTVTKHICIEEQPECWRLDDEAALLRRAWLLYGDA